MVAGPIVELVGGVPPTSPQFWLDAATQAVRSYCGWHVAPVETETVVLDGPGGKTLYLPTHHVQAIISVHNDGLDVTGSVDVSPLGILELKDGRWTRRLGGVVVEFSHGYALEDVADVAGVISRLAKRAAAAAGNITSQAAGTMRVNYGTVNGLPAGVDLFSTDKDLLARYKMVQH